MGKKIVKLRSLVTDGGIFSGYSFRGKIKASKGGSLRVIQLKDIENEYTTIGSDCIFIDKNQVKDKYYLRDGDLLFTSKGANNYALPFYKLDKLLSVASSAFFVIRLDKQKTDPNYIAWYINQKKVQQYLESQATGTYTTSINRETIENIPILLPIYSVQQQIASVADLAAKELNLYNQLLNKKNQLIQAQLMTSLKQIEVP